MAIWPLVIYCTQLVTMVYSNADSELPPVMGEFKLGESKTRRKKVGEKQSRRKINIANNVWAKTNMS